MFCTKGLKKITNCFFKKCDEKWEIYELARWIAAVVPINTKSLIVIVVFE